MACLSSSEETPGRGSLLVIRDAVNPSMEAAGKTSVFFTPRRTSKRPTSDAHDVLGGFHCRIFG
jgi:hypothetical protein